MSDEKEAQNEDWRIDSLDEEEDIIELTDEIDPPAQKKTANLDQLDEIVIDLEDGATPALDEELHELTEAAVDEVSFDEVALFSETDGLASDLEDEPKTAQDDELHELSETVVDEVSFDEVALFSETDGLASDFEDEPKTAHDDELHELSEAAVDEVGFDEVALFSETDGLAGDLEDEAKTAFDVEEHELPEAEVEYVSFDEIEPVDETDELIAGFERDLLAAPDDEVHELMETAVGDVGFDHLESAGDSEEIAIDFEDEILPTPNAELQATTAGDGDLEELLPRADGDEIDIGFEDETDPAWDEPVEELSEAALEEVGLEELQLFESATEIGMTDMETEVDIAEIADLEPVQPDPPIEEALFAAPEADLNLQEEFTTDLVESMVSPTDEIIEISDFDQQYFGDEEAESPVTDIPSEESIAEDDFLELIDVDDAEDDDHESDDDIIHFSPASAGTEITQIDEILSESDRIEADLETPFEEDAPAEFISESGPVPGFFESSLSEEDNEFEPQENIGAQTDLENDAQVDTLDTDDAAIIPAAVSATQIEAAVANIIERDYAGKIESMVAGAVEKVVSLEIERIKSRLSADEDD